MSTRWIVARLLSGVANPRRDIPHGQGTAGTVSSCVIMKFCFFVDGAADGAGGVMMATACGPQAHRQRLAIKDRKAGDVGQLPLRSLAARPPCSSPTSSAGAHDGASS